MTKIICLHNGHDASIGAFEDGEMLHYWELERVLNIKHLCGINYSNSPLIDTLFNHCLPMVGWDLDDVDYFVLGGQTEFYNTELKHLLPQNRNSRTPNNARYFNDYEKPYEVFEGEWRGKMRKFVAVMHHVSHMALAYYTSPFDKCLVFAYDGLGDFDTSTIGGIGDNGKLHYKWNFRHDPIPGTTNNGIGLCYSYLGRLFPFLGTKDLLATAGKAMGLSSYGTPYQPGHPIYDICYRMITDWMPDPSKYKQELAAHGYRREEYAMPGNDKCHNLMATIQECLERYLCNTIDSMSNECADAPWTDNLAMAGGCALNVQANTRLQKEGIVKNVYFPPATSDCGIAYGATLYTYYHILENEWKPCEFHNPYLGDEVYSPVDLEGNPGDVADWMNKNYPELSYCQNGDIEEQIYDAARFLAERKIIAWAQGRCEIGPRALGNRSILCHPGPLQDHPSDMKWLDKFREGGGSMKLTINEAVKHREFWRPFAPIALWPDCQEYFESDHEQPYMLEAPMAKDWDMSEASSAWRKWWDIPAVVHVDGTSRVQTVTEKTNETMNKLLREFKSVTGLPVLLNTSLNDAGIPINNKIEDILNLVRDTDVDYAFIGNWFFWKKK